MKQINFLSKSGGQSMGLRSVTLALTVGSPSVHRRSTMLKLISVLVLVFTFGVGNVWGADEVYKTALFGNSNNSAGNSSYTSTFTSTTDGFVVTAANFNNNNNGWNGQIKCGRKNNASVAYISTNAAIDKKVTKVAVNIDAITAAKVNSIKLYRSSNGSTWTEESSFTKATGLQEANVAEANQAANLYYKVEFDCASGSSNGLVTVSKVEYYAAEEEEDVIVKTLKSIAVSGQTTTYDQFETFSFDGICTATYSVTKNDVPQADEQEVVTPTSVSSPNMSTTGIKEVTVTFTDDNVTKTANYNITVTEHVVTPGTYDITPNDTFFGKDGQNGAKNVTANSLDLSNSKDDITVRLQNHSSTNSYFNTTSSRVYNGYTLDISVPSGFNITAISFTGSTWVAPTESAGTMDIKNWSAGKDKVNSVTFTFSGTSYMTNISVTYEAACTELGSINGSVSVTSGTSATLTWGNVTGAESYKVKVPGSTSHNDWTTATSGVNVTGLTAGQNYTAYFKAFDSNGSHCSEGPESTTAFTTPKITVTGTLNPFVYIHNSGPSAAQSITISAVGMAGNVTIAAPDYFEVCETENGTYTSSVSLTPTSGTVASTTIYVRLKGELDEGSYGASNVVVSGNYAASVNVSVSGTVSPSCHTPSISVQPTASVSYNLNATATALSVTAAKGDNADPALTYQWKQCATINGDYANVASNGTSSTYTPSTAAIGTIYYKCEVSSGACSKLSDAAAVTVNTPTITVGDNKTSHAFGDKAIGSENTVTISVSGTNLAKDQNIGLALSGAGVSAYSLSANSLTASNGTVEATDVTITYTAVAGASNATLTISSAGAVSKTITLSGTGKYQVTYYANGDMEHPFATKLADGDGKLVLPDGNPTSCDAAYTTFIGWYSTAAGNNGSPTTNISTCGTKAETTHSLTSNETYYAVFGDGGLSADEVKQVTLDFTDNTDWGFPTDYQTESASYSQNGVEITMANAGDGWKFDSNSSYFIFGSANSTMTFPAFSFDVSKIVVTGRSGASGKTEQNIFVGETEVSTGTKGVTGTNTYVINSNYQEAGTIYVLKITSAHKSQVTSIEIYSPGKAATGFISSCCTKHNVSISDGLVNGSVTSSLASACEGTSVTLTATPTPNAGRFKTWNVTGMTLTNEQKATNPLTISMPDNDITVSATFDALYAISKVEEGGTITLGNNYAAENDVVTISAVAKQDYEEPRVLKVYKTNDESTEITITNGQFTMPGYPVTAKVTYTPSKTPLPAPTMGANTNLSYNSVQINWTNVANNSGYALTVKQGDDIVEGYDAKTIDQDATSAVISGLEHLTAYTYSLYAKGDGITYVAVNTAANGGFTTLDYPTVKIYYSENEVLRDEDGTDQKILTDFTLPNNALTGCTQKELVGWTTAANAEYSHDTDAPAGMMLPGAKWQIPTNANCTLYAVYAKNNPETVSWSRVTTMSTLTDGGTFIMGYESTAKSGMLIPLRSADCGATTTANGYFNAGTSSTSSGSGTIDMSSVTSTSDYEVYISSPADGKINIQQSSSTGNYYGSSSTGSSKNTGRLYTSGNSDETNIIPEWSSEDNNQFKLRVNVSGDYKYLKYNTGDPRFAFYNSAGEKVVFYKKNVTPATTTKYATQCMAQVAKPSISGVTDGETYEEAKTITITSATTGATIYYTTNGTEPTTSSNAYSAPFEVSANGDYTIRAIAVKADMVNSDEATAVSFTLDLPFTTIASFIEATPATAKKLAFTAESNARVLAYNKNRIYIQDGTGAMYLYNTGSNNEGHGKTWASGKKIVGTLTGTYTTNDNMPRMTVTDFGATDVTDDAIELPTPIAVEELATNFGNNVCKLVTINGVSIRSESVDDNKTINMTKNDVTYNIYNAFNALTGHKLPLGTTSCTVTGILGQSNSGATLQLMPISADGISTNGAEAVLPVLNVTGSTNSAEPFEVATNKVITFTPNSNFSAVYAVNDGEETAVGNSTNVTITDEVNATKVYIKATREYYTDKEVTYYYLANPALIEYDITKGAMSHGSATIQNAQGDAITYAVGGATVTLVANPAEHYHWVSWEVTAGGEPVTVTNNTFEMPNAAVTVSATFEEDDYATVAFAKGNASVTGDAPASQKVYVGENATMPGKGSMILSSHNFAGWKLGNNAVLNTGDTYTVTAEDHEAGTITFEAQWEPYPWASAGKWELVTDEEDLNAGDYVVIACNSQSTIAGDISNNIMASVDGTFSGDKNSITSIGDACVLTLGKSDDNWTFTNVDAELLGATAAKNLAWGSSGTTTWSISIADAEGEYKATIQNTTSTYGRFLYNSGQPRFTTYTSSTSVSMILPQLYKFVGGSYYNIVYAKGTEDEVRNMPEGHVTDENGEAAIKENTPIRVGYTFTGWKDQDENVYTYNDGQIYAFTKNVTLTAQWEEQTDKYTVSYDANGSSDAVPAEAAYFENAEVTVAGAVSKEGFVFIGWECNGRVYTAGSRFYMPAADMPMVAKYAHGATYDNMTKVSNVYSIESHDAPEGSEAVFTNSYTTAKQITNGNSMTLTLSGYTGYTIEGVKLSTGSNNTSGKGTLSITIGGVEVATDANADKWYNGVHHYGSNNGTDFENVLVSMNPKTVKYGEDIVITIAASESSLYCQSFTILYDLLPVEVENTTTIEARDLAAGTEVIIHDGGTLNVNADKSLDNLIIEAGGTVVLDENKLTVVGTFTIETTMASGASGQLIGATASNFATNGPAYIDITLGAGGRADHWHAITVPFPVDAINGIYDLDGNKLNNEEHYAIMEYLGNVRAQGKYGWKKYRKTLVPGTFYLMTVDGGRTTYRFMKTADGALVAGNSKEIFEYAKSGEGQTTDAGWNGVGNPTLTYGKVNAEVQVLDPVSYTYIKKDANSTNFVVGTPFFYQAATAGSISMLTADAGANYAPARVAANGIEKIKVSFGNEEFTDYLDISASEEALNEYQIGKDLAKMTMTNTPSVAQIFGNAYNAKLCMVYAPMVNDKATFDLTLYAPAAGTYTIAAPSMENATLYLTKNGRIYWNLTMGACELDLNQGQNNEYGLVLRAEVPAVTTGIENGGMLNGENGVQKVVIDEHVYILRGGEMYDMTGKMVK